MAEKIIDAWVELPSEEELREQMEFHYDYGFLPKMNRLILAHPRIGVKFGELTSEVMFGPGLLSREEREMVSAVTSASQQCSYCAGNHAEFMRTEGGDVELVRAIHERRWRDVETLTPRQRALCELAEKLSTHHARMTEADWQPLRDLGFSDQGLLEVAHIVGMFNHLNRLANGFGLILDDLTREAMESDEPLRRDGRPSNVWSASVAPGGRSG